MATKKKKKKMMAKAIAFMPTIMTETHEVHHVKGEELIAQGHTEVILGGDEKIDAEKVYKQDMPVLIARNHTKGFMKAFAKGGQQGVANYIKRMRKIVESN